MADVQFPHLREELLQILHADQKELREFEHKYKKLTSESERKRALEEARAHNRARSERLQEILIEIRRPTIEQIGRDGSGAVSVLALHSELKLVKHVLRDFEEQFKIDKKTVYFQAIPSLADRVSIVETRKQRYGTNWMVDEAGHPFLIEVEDFAKMNQHRAKYGLGPAKKPTNLSLGAKKYPVGQGLAQESDQKKLTDKEYEQYCRPLLEELRFTKKKKSL